MNKKYYEDKNKNAYEIKTPLEELMWKEIGEMWEELLPKIEERDKYKEVLDKIKELSNRVKEEAKEVENGWAYQIMKELDYLLEEIE